MDSAESPKLTRFDHTSNSNASPISRNGNKITVPTAFSVAPTTLSGSSVVVVVVVVVIGVSGPVATVP
jgi:hypothetical protein